MEGYLQKWQNPITRWKEYYFILHEDVLIFCNKKGGQKLGSVHLKIASLNSAPNDPLKIVINSGIMEITLKAKNASEKNMWLQALNKAKNLDFSNKLTLKELEEITKNDPSISNQAKNILQNSNYSKLDILLAQIWQSQAKFEEALSILSPQLDQNNSLAKLAEELEKQGQQIKTNITRCVLIVEEEWKNLHRGFQLLNTQSKKQNNYFTPQTQSIIKNTPLQQSSHSNKNMQNSNHFHQNSPQQQQFLQQQQFQQTNNENSFQIQHHETNGRQAKLSNYQPINLNSSFNQNNNTTFQFKSFQHDPNQSSNNFNINLNQSQHKLIDNQANTNRKQSNYYNDNTVFESFIGDDANYHHVHHNDQHANTSQVLAPLNQQQQQQNSNGLHPIIQRLLKNKNFTVTPILNIEKRDKLYTQANPELTISFWSILKQSLGQDLSKITFPVVLNEPLSMLQKMAEIFQNFNLLNLADQQQDSALRMAYVMGFAVSYFSTQLNRKKKPFNPLLHETYELINKDFTFVSEQVSHHPPISAAVCFNNHFEFNANSQSSTTFGGMNMEIKPLSKRFIHLKKHNDHFEYEQCTSYIKNIVIGSMYTDSYGNMPFKNTSTQETGLVTLKEKSWNGSGQYELSGHIKNSAGQELYSIKGKWNQNFIITNKQTKQETTQTRPKSLGKWRRNFRS
ncbi:hypothetical protein PPERSA_13061 [Pseudocohnilembus persalinus]|uniref:PH domain-containing protein n=1 Tax=Pseudocohnilembus persalinus TaxID=266149 RepID=A0A0V0QWJ7_PSEPJ|nr:hypothetical protein PPERSA_13061 [Pseudocohnilembus persalinus]|eukprot:KRX06582.1 hypothetical protein PPERSA_13061 [Pseudocohnilembus persalinus]